MLLWAFASTCSLLAGACTDDCLRHSDCPGELKCYGGICQLVASGDGAADATRAADSTRTPDSAQADSAQADSAQADGVRGDSVGVVDGASDSADAAPNDGGPDGGG